MSLNHLPPQMPHQAYDLTRLVREVEESPAHPGGTCSVEHMRCAGCGRPALIAPQYGSLMARCRVCWYAWAVKHHPAECWQRVQVSVDIEALRRTEPLLVALAEQLRSMDSRAAVSAAED